jgi:hypothetical protein
VKEKVKVNPFNARVDLHSIKRKKSETLCSQKN